MRKVYSIRDNMRVELELRNVGTEGVYVQRSSLCLGSGGLGSALLLIDERVIIGKRQIVKGGVIGIAQEGRNSEVILLGTQGSRLEETELKALVSRIGTCSHHGGVRVEYEPTILKIEPSKPGKCLIKLSSPINLRTLRRTLSVGC